MKLCGVWQKCSKVQILKYRNGTSCMPAQKYVLGVYGLRIRVLDEMSMRLQAYIHTPKS